MKFLSLAAEKKLWKQGIFLVAGLDEVGRGPLAGPVVAGAVIVLGTAAGKQKLPKINDSKKLSPKKREELHDILVNHPRLAFGLGMVSERIIDKINILEATKLAMKKAFLDLHKKTPIDMLLIDGTINLSLDAPQRSIIKGDQKIFSIAAASIIAKVTRDRFMEAMHKKYPDYGFNIHKGYGTALHLERLFKFGACPIHRKTFYPISFPQKSIAGVLIKR